MATSTDAHNHASQDCPCKEMFQVIGPLDEGGFGTVVKVRHKVDGQNYAKKMVPVTEMRLKVDEARILAALTHPNVVRYHVSFFGNEPYSGSQSSSAESSSIGYSQQAEDISDGQTGRISADFPETKDSLDSITFEQTGSGDSLEQTEDSAGDSSEARQLNLIIYMELCNTTLRNLMDIRNDRVRGDPYTVVNVDMNKDLLKQILKGLSYVHREGVIHRDIKPSNIFLRETDGHPPQVKLGDFGLSRQVDAEHASNPEELKLTSGLGTPPYTSPEVLSGSPYGYNSDMYSLGWIILEMFHPFSTRSEFLMMIEDLKKGIFPDTFKDHWPEECLVVSQLLSEDPNSRPSAAQLLAKWFPTKAETIEQLRAQVTAKEESISQLVQKLHVQDAENAELKKRIAELEGRATAAMPLGAEGVSTSSQLNASNSSGVYLQETAKREPHQEFEVPDNNDIK